VVGRYEALFVDLDGVVYRGNQPVPGARTVLDRVRERGTSVLFITNNSSRAPGQVAEMLGGLGIRATASEVMTSAVATATMLEREGARGLQAFVVGELGIRAALEEVGIRVLDGEPHSADMVVVGWDRTVDYAKLRAASLLVQRGARLVATNADPTYPAPDGLWPGAGAILAAVVAASGGSPTVVGKPSKPMFDAARERSGTDKALVVGDRIDTDVLGAARAGLDSLVVFSGVATPAELLGAAELPTYAATGLDLLLKPVPPARFRPASAEDLPGIEALLRSAGLSVEGLARRMGSTVVSTGGGRREGPADATACVETIEGWGLLRSVAVRSDLRGNGLGMLAVAAAARAATARGSISHLFLLTEESGPFFELLGFRRLDRGDLPEPVRGSSQVLRECPETATAMALQLERGR
jgi:HAD superfamily hydrolase (TIGR01457 family)